GRVVERRPVTEARRLALTLTPGARHSHAGSLAGRSQCRGRMVASGTAIAWPVPAGGGSEAATVSRVLRQLRGTAKKGPGGLASPNNLWRAMQTQSGPLRGEALALRGQPVEERRRRPEGVAALRLELQQPVAPRPEAHRIGPEHGATPIDRPAPAVNPEPLQIPAPDAH